MSRATTHTTKIKPKSLTRVYFSVYFSYLYVGLLEACVVGRTRSSMKTSLMRLLTAVAPILEVDRDHRTTPDVVKISKASNISRLACGERVEEDRQCLCLVRWLT